MTACLGAAWLAFRDGAYLLYQVGVSDVLTQVIVCDIMFLLRVYRKTKESAMIKYVDRYDIVGLLETGLIGTVTFIKKDGSRRVLTGRMGVKKHTVGGVRTTDPRDYAIVWEINNAEGHTGRAAYRNVNIHTIQSLVMSGVTYIPHELRSVESGAVTTLPKTLM